MPEPKKLSMIVCWVLALGTLALYSPVLWHGFLNYDDPDYILDNPHVKGGITWSGIIWAFTSNYAANWHPLTWISHMVDCQLFGLRPAGHHLMNALFHTANTLLLFILLKNLTGAIWRSAFVAALFAWHPLHVESVAWAAERKDVLSAFFWMLTLIAYANYAKVQSSSGKSKTLVNYLLALVLFACGLMSKPMVVTLPFVLWLLDFWPLQRLTLSTAPKLLLEKIPFFGLVAASCALTLFAQKIAYWSATSLPLHLRLENAFISYARYILKIFWPEHLAVIYPYPRSWPLAEIIVATAVLLALTVIFIAQSKRFPYLVVGWLWFLGTLVPTIGIVQVGSQSMADRYAYLPSIGIFIIIAWGTSDFLHPSPEKAHICIISGSIALAACLILTSLQLRYWQNGLTLFGHAVKVTKNNYAADVYLGKAWENSGKWDLAENYYEKAISLEPYYAVAQFDLGMNLFQRGQPDAASNHLELATQLWPENPIIPYNFGVFLLKRGTPSDAATYFKVALADDPGFAEAYNAMGKALLKSGKAQEAAQQFLQAATLEPANAQFHYDAGAALLNNSEPGQAVDELSEAVRLQPKFAVAQEKLAVALAGQGKLAEAITHFSKVVELQPNDPNAHFNLGFACLLNHQSAEAAIQFSEELRLTPNETKAHYRLAQALQQQNQLAEAVTQYRQALQLNPNFPEATQELNAILAAHPELRAPSK